jgi:hypothetical protein
MPGRGAHETAIAAEADRTHPADSDAGIESRAAVTALWWEVDPQLRDRFGTN